MSIKSPFIILIIAVSFSASDISFAQTCNEIERKSEAGQILIPSYESGHKVVGKGRAYIYSAPNETCYNSQLFLIPGDLLNAYSEYNGFIYILYFHPATGRETTGWIKANRLEKSGSGVGPKK